MIELVEEWKKLDWNIFLFKRDGRISRRQYWLHFYVPFMLVNSAANLIDNVIGIPLMAVVVGLLVIWPSIVVGVKRCHDRDRSGWFLLVGLIPIVNLWPFVELGFLRGTIGPNRFGLDPVVPPAV